MTDDPAAFADDPLLSGLAAMHRFNTALREIRTSPGAHTDRFAMIATAITQMWPPDQSDIAWARWRLRSPRARSEYQRRLKARQRRKRR